MKDMIGRVVLVLAAAAIFCFGCYSVFFDGEADDAPAGFAQDFEKNGAASKGRSVEADAIVKPGAEAKGAAAGTSSSAQEKDVPVQVTVEEISRPAAISHQLGTAEGPFLLLKLTVKNTGKSALKLNAGHGLHVEDAAGNRYDVDLGGMDALMHNGVPTFHMQIVNPGTAKTASVVFAFPPDAEPVCICIQPFDLHATEYRFRLK